MRKFKILILDANAKEGMELRDFLIKEGHDAQHMTGLLNINEAKSKDIIVMKSVLENEVNGKKEYQDGISLAKTLEEVGITTPRILIGKSSEENTSEVVGKFRAFIDQSSIFDRQKLKKNVREEIEKILGVYLNIGITGMGRLGQSSVNEVKNESYIDCFCIHSNHYRGNYASLWDMVTIPENRRRGFQSIEDMIKFGAPDVIFIAAGVRGETSPAEGEETKDRSVAFPGTMKVLESRVRPIAEAYKNRTLNALTVIGSGPQDIIIPYLVENYGFPPNKITGITPEQFRGKSLIRNRIVAAVYAFEMGIKNGEMANLGEETAIMLEGLSGGDLSRTERERIGRLTEGELADISKLSQEERARLKMLTANDIELMVLGGRGYPMPLYFASTVLGEPIQNKFENFVTEERQNWMAQRLKLYGWEKAKTAKQEESYYDDAAKEFKKLLYCLHKGITNPPNMLYALNPEYQIYMQGPVRLEHEEGNGYTVSWNQERVPQLPEQKKAIFKENIEAQKKITKQRIEEYKEQKNN